MADAAKPLDGVRVLAQGIVWAGPFSTMILADLGAEVIEIESIQPPQPDAHLLPAHLGASSARATRARAYAQPRRQRGLLEPATPSSTTASAPTSRVTLDLHSERGHALFLDLVRHSDAFVENNAAEVRRQPARDRLADAGARVEPAADHDPLPRLRASSGPYRDFKGFGANDGGAGRPHRHPRLRATRTPRRRPPTLPRRPERRGAHGVRAAGRAVRSASARARAGSSSCRSSEAVMHGHVSLRLDGPRN